MYKIIALAALCLSLVGCCSNRDIEATQRHYRNQANNILPDKMMIIEDLGRQWYIVKLDDNKYLFHSISGSITPIDYEKGN